MNGASDRVDIYEELGTEYCPGTPNSTGKAAEMFVTGSRALADDELALRAGPLPDAPAIFYYGPTQTNLAFGLGTLCIGAPRYRVAAPVRPTNKVAGVRVHPAQLAHVPGRLHFQCVYRDPGAPSPHFNTSMAYTIEFVP